MTGLLLAQYRIESEIGRGGMGIVYRATDTKLGRTVALKVLPAAALSSEDDRARFFREAQAAAQLAHPNIAGVHQIDEAVPVDADGNEVGASDGPRPFIAMEFIDGETVSERVKRGPLTFRESVTIAGQVAEALKAAHAKGIVHRDIKSANVMLTAEGVAKVLDFGLAKTNQSTMLTRMGSTLGTVAYMSPEQARGQEVDGRTDLYSLGTMLYEMVAGRLPFAGDYEQAVLYGILNEPPEPLTALRTGVPMELERIAAKLLSKEAEYRYQTAADLIADLKALDVTGSGVSRRSMAAVSAAGVRTAPAAARTALPVWVWGAMVGMLVVGALGTWWLKPTPTASDRPVMRTRLVLPDAMSPLAAALTPDGRRLFYAAEASEGGSRVLAVYDFRTGVSNQIAGTEGAQQPFVSHDGRWVAFRVNTEWWRMPVEGGQPALLTGTGAQSALAGFAIDGSLHFTAAGWRTIRRYDDAAGTSDVLTDSASFISGIVALGESGKLIYTGWSGPGIPRGSYLYGQGADAPTTIMPEASVHAVTANGRALFHRGGDAPQTLAVPIDLETGALRGPEVALGRFSLPLALSRTGVLVYEEREAQADGTIPADLYRIAPEGRAEKLFSMPGAGSQEISVSHDGTRLLVSARAEREALADMYLVDLQSGTPTRLTQGGYYEIPSWSHDDAYVYFDHQPPGETVWRLMRRRADGLGTNELVLPDSLDVGDPSLSTDGRYLVFAWGDDIGLLDLAADTMTTVVRGPGRQVKPRISPDGRYLVYVDVGEGSSWMCGSIQVRPLLLQGSAIELASRGCMPAWARDGKSVLFELDGSIWRVPVTTEPAFRNLGFAEIAFSGPPGRDPNSDRGIFFDTAPDGSIFVSYPEGARSSSDRPIWVVANWFEELERLVPATD